MHKFYAAIVAGLFACLSAFPQTDGPFLAYDRLTDTFLATVPEAAFHGMAEGDTTAVAPDGSVRHARLCYTFLPILQLTGTFGYNYHDGEVVLADPEGAHLYRLQAAVKWRGGSTNAADKHKRNYKIKLQGDTTLLGLRSDNNWILDAGQADVFRLRNKVAMDVWNAIGSTPYYHEQDPRARLGISGRVVEVFVNDEYMGIYNLSENLDRKQTRVKKVSSEKGIRGCLYKSAGWGLGQMYDEAHDYDNHAETWKNIEVKYPDLNDCDTTDWTTLAQAINFVATSSDAAFQDEVDDYFDLPVIIDFCIFGSVMNAYDNRGKNLFWAVYNKQADKRLTLAPWDLDCTVGQRWGGYLSDDYVRPDTVLFMNFNLTRRLASLCQLEETMADRYTELRGGVLSTDSLTRRYSDVFLQLKHSGAARREEQRWSGDSDIKGETLDFELEHRYICDWIEHHMEAMDRKYLKPAEEPPLVSRSEVDDAGLYVVEVTTVGGEEPQGENIESPVYEGVYNFIYTNKVPCRIVITHQRDTLYDSGLYEKGSSGATIRINGNTTAYFSRPLNMPYKLKLERKADLLSRNDSLFADKHWRLLKDARTLNTIAGLKLSELMGMEWTAAYRPCNLIINGDYRGCYLLMETVKRNTKCRIDTDKDGYIVERDPYWWKEDSHFVTSWYEKAQTYRWTWKYPDSDDVTDAQQQYIQQYINLAEKAIRGGNYEQYIDVNSFAQWLLSHDILGTRDSGGSNMFFKKYDSTSSSRIEMPCLWDFDSSYDMPPGSFSRLHTTVNAYFSTLLESTNRTFARTYVSLWEKVRDAVKETLINFLEDYPATAEGQQLDASRRLYDKRWGSETPTTAVDAAYAIQWLQEHLTLIDEKIRFVEDVSAVAEAGVNADTNYTYYNIKGQQCRPTVGKELMVLRQNGTGKVVKYFQR